MTPAEQNLMRLMLREEMGVAIDPVKKDIDGIKIKIGGLEASARDARREIDVLKDTDRKHSGGFKQVRTELLPRLESQTAEQIAIERGDREKGLSVAATAYERMVKVVDTLTERMAGMESELSSYRREAEERAAKASLVVPDGKGGTAIVPASVVGANAAMSSNNKADAIQLAANRADTHSLAAKSRSSVTLIATIVQALIMGAWGAYHIIHGGP